MRGRLQKIISSHGIASRRRAEALIVAGRVCVNGEIAGLGQSADLNVDKITVDGIAIGAPADPVYIMLNKPCGFLTTTYDERGRKTVMSLIGDIGTRVYPVGRLDLDTEGLLLFTNDGHFANIIMHPSGNTSKTYEITVDIESEVAAKRLSREFVIDGAKVKAQGVWAKKTTNDNVVVITIAEGRNRQIRKMCSECNIKVIHLVRTSIGFLSINKLKTGQWRHLTSEEVHKFMPNKNIAIDGPAGSGKSSLAKRVAKHFNLIYVDTGALYRTIALYIFRKGISSKNTHAIVSVLPEISVMIKHDDSGNQRMLLCDEDVTDLIRTPEVSLLASDVSAIPEVRDFLFDLQRNIAATKDVVMDGRDIGTVILPDAAVKIFITASVQERARRRFLELEEKGSSISYDDVLSQMISRDKQDSERDIAPLVAAEDAITLDTSELDFEQSFEALCSLIKDKI